MSMFLSFFLCDYLKFLALCRISFTAGQNTQGHYLVSSKVREGFDRLHCRARVVLQHPSLRGIMK